MKKALIAPQDQVFWYLPHHEVKPLNADISTDVVVIGGGMAGLTAAQSFAQKGCKVVLLEKNFCGSGASGKSSGFITPDAELSLHDLIDSYGHATGQELWEFIDSGVQQIRKNITTHNLDCDYQVQDTLIIANTQKSFIKQLAPEHQARLNCKYTSSLHDCEQLQHVLGSKAFHGGVSYGDTFGIQGYRYCQGMKQVLQQQGVQIYEESPVLRVQDKLVTTHAGSVKADHIIICTDYGTSMLDTSIKRNVYHAQTFLMVSAPLIEQQIRTIFPQKKFMVWDTDMIYQYFRVTGDNRLLLGGASLLYTYAKYEKHNSTWMFNKLSSYWQKNFPKSPVEWHYMWPGLIGISKDLFPIAGFDKDIPSVYYVTAAAGLPWAAALGLYSADHVLNNKTCFDEILSPCRATKIGPFTQALLGTRLAFAINNFLTVSSM